MGLGSKKPKKFHQMDSEDDSDPEFTVWFKSLKNKSLVEKMPEKTENDVDSLNLIQTKKEISKNGEEIIFHCGLEGKSCKDKFLVDHITFFRSSEVEQLREDKTSVDNVEKQSPNKEEKLEKLRSKQDEAITTCPTCNKRLSTRQTLKSHLRIHTGEKPYVCNFTGKKESSRILKSKLDQNFTERSICLKRFRTSSAVSQHRSTHLNYKKCKFCKKSFKLSYIRGHIHKMHKKEPTSLSQTEMTGDIERKPQKA